MLFIVAAALASTFPAPSRWTWKGHSVNYVTAGSSGPPVLLVHGFAGSAFNCWRSTVPALAETHRVYAIDLLGLGASDQPSDVTYSIELWRDQCAAFVDEIFDEPPIVIGHSFGSNVALELAASSNVRAVGMMNCGVGMNNKGAFKVAQADVGAPGWQLAIFGVVLSLIDVILKQKWLVTKILTNFATDENVRGALTNAVYVNGAQRVDDALVNDYLSLASDTEAATEVLSQIYTNDSGPLPFEAANKLPDELPILALWGDTDNLSPITGPVGTHFRARAERLEATRFEELTACGHVPQDDKPEEANRFLREWLASV